MAFLEPFLDRPFPLQKPFPYALLTLSPFLFIFPLLAFLLLLAVFSLFDPGLNFTTNSYI